MENFDEIEFLSQPFLTDDGFVNPACMNELGAAINNMPPTYERLAADVEWSTKEFTCLGDILGALAKWAVRQSPYACPDNLEIVLKYTDACLRRNIVWEDFGDHLYAQLSLCEINKFLHDILMGLEQFDAWNQPKLDWRKDNKDGFQEACTENPDYDYIDLHALLRNVCLDIRLERRDFKKFNDEFEAKHGKVD